MLRLNADAVVGHRHRIIVSGPPGGYRHLDQSAVADALRGRLSPDALTAEEQEAYVDGLLEQARDGTPEQEKFFARRRALARKDEAAA